MRRFCTSTPLLSQARGPARAAALPRCTCRCGARKTRATELPRRRRRRRCRCRPSWAARTRSARWSAIWTTACARTPGAPRRGPRPGRCGRRRSRPFNVCSDLLGLSLGLGLPCPYSCCYMPCTLGAWRPAVGPLPWQVRPAVLELHHCFLRIACGPRLEAIECFHVICWGRGCDKLCSRSHAPQSCS